MIAGASFVGSCSIHQFKQYANPYDLACQNPMSPNVQMDIFDELYMVSVLTSPTTQNSVSWPVLWATGAPGKYLTRH